MFARRFSFVMAFLLAFLVLGVVQANAEKRTALAGTIAWDEDKAVLVSWREIGTNAQFEVIWVGTLMATDPHLSGIGTFNFMCNARLTTPMPWWGPCNGTWSLDVDADDLPEWSGNMHVVPQLWGPSEAKLVGKGMNEYTGLQVEATMIAGEPYTFSGEIRDPKAH